MKKEAEPLNEHYRAKPGNKLNELNELTEGAIAMQVRAIAFFALVFSIVNVSYLY
ncbi:MAG: hypothetical protein HC879_18430 [Leptolyngbyaceae cyanobacterium SL_5_9]|nr:hypothetical protein [Leptolyngbyaceae cyanobacterium SL_5_9]NJO74372.1 hypothetical protein [Leptolyngbyaceae cyanobacterium RM1_406_9]